MTPKQTAAQGTAFSFEEIWNLFMSEHEPQLMTDVLPDLEVVLDSEPAKARRVHIANCVKAIQLFAERFGKFIELWKGELHKRKKALVAAAKENAGAEEATKLHDIEQNFSQQ